MDEKCCTLNRKMKACTTIQPRTRTSGHCFSKTRELHVPVSTCSKEAADDKISGKCMSHDFYQLLIKSCMLLENDSKNLVIEAR
jgi:hypothetical protein